MYLSKGILLSNESNTVMSSVYYFAYYADVFISAKCMKCKLELHKTHK